MLNLNYILGFIPGESYDRFQDADIFDRGKMPV